jgi:hypothetical protein
MKSFNDLYSSPSTVWVMKLRRMRWVSHVVHMGEERHRWEDNIKMGL